MNSMTGYGKGVAERYERKITIELKSVNHRFLDLLFKLPRGFQFAEDLIRKTVSQSITRGHLDIFLTYEDNRTSKNMLALDRSLAESYLRIASELQAMGYVNDLSVSTVLKTPEIVKLVESSDDEAILSELISEATEASVANLTRMRATEGRKLVEDLAVKIDALEAGLKMIEERAPAVAEDYRKKLSERIAEALQGVQMDEARLCNEVAFFIDKTNIDEEMTRLRGHIAHYRELLYKEEPTGKQLDFLTQEANREVNTIGSKCSDAEITKGVLYLKNLIEMIREQVQNLE
jgi:uncharacterized protein (TIGR00255 family)